MDKTILAFSTPIRVKTTQVGIIPDLRDFVILVADNSAAVPMSPADARALAATLTAAADECK